MTGPDQDRSTRSRWPPEENCYCGGPEEIYPHRVGTGYYCRPEPATPPDTAGETP